MATSQSGPTLMRAAARALMVSATLLTGISSGQLAGAESESILINEIHYHPASEDVQEEFVELFNISEREIDLSGWALSDGVERTISESVVLPPGGYLVMAADRQTFLDKYPEVDAVVGGWEGTLSNGGESIALRRANGELVDRVFYADEGPWATERRQIEHLGRLGWDWVSEADGGGSSLELRNSSLDNALGHNWKASLANGGSPGKRNSVASDNIAPAIFEVAHRPVIPTSGEKVTVTVRVADEQSDGLTVTLYYRKAGGPRTFSSVEMQRAANQGEPVSGRVAYKAVIPAQPDRSIVELYAQARDAEGKVRQWPETALLRDGTRAHRANLLYEVDDRSAQADKRPSSQPVYRVVLPREERNRLTGLGNSDAEMNGTVITQFNGRVEVRYLVGVRLRGHGSRFQFPRSFRINFRHDRPWQEVTALNLNSQFSYLQHLGSSLCQMAGLRAADVDPVQLRINGRDVTDTGPPHRTFGSYAALEVVDGDYVDNHFPQDSSGNAYRGRRDEAPADFSYRGGDPQAYQNSYFKETNESQNDWTGLIRLTRVLTKAPEEDYAERVREVIHVREWLDHLAVMAIMDNRESGINTGHGDDYYIYRGMADPRFFLIPHDLDSILGQGFGRGRVDAGIWGATGMPAFERLLSSPKFAPAYFAALRRQMETTFSEERFGTVVDQTLAPYVPLPVIDHLKSFVKARKEHIRKQIPSELTIESDLARQAGHWISPDASISLSGRADPVRTRSVRVKGLAADWLPRQARWSVDDLPIEPGLGRVVVRAFDREDKLLDERSITVWRPTDSVRRITGQVKGARDWSSTEGPFIIDGSVTIPSGSRLTIEAGTTVYLTQGSRLVVHGQLIAEGSEAEPIRISRPPAGQGRWDRLEFIDAGPSSRLSYVDFELGGGGGELIHVENSDLVVEHARWRESDATFVSADGAGLTLIDSRFDGGSARPLVEYETASEDDSLRIERNRFGSISGGAAMLDLASHVENPGVIQVIDNRFVGGQGNGIRLEGGAAYIEGNHFVGFQRAPTVESLVWGVGAAEAKLFLVRNVFRDNEVAIGLGGSSRMIGEHNTIVDCTVGAVGVDLEPLGGSSQPGGEAGASGELLGNIFWDNGSTFVGIDSSEAREAFTASQSLVEPESDLWPDGGNLNRRPRFVASGEALRLQQGSPGVGAGPLGLDMGAFVPRWAAISGSPEGPTSRTDVTIDVGGPGITHYKYRVNDEDFSDSYPISKPLRLEGLENGRYRVAVLGRNAAGEWQPRQEATRSAVWQVDRELSRVRINEILAINNTVLDRNGGMPDVVELVYLGNGSKDISGMSLSDDPAAPRKFVFGAGTTIDSEEHKLILGGEDAGGEGGVPRLGFNLNGDGEALHLYESPEDGGAVVDSVTFGHQLPDRSIGRLETGEWGLTRPTPGSPNVAIATGDPHSIRLNEWLSRPSEDSGGRDFIELYNPGVAPVDLSGLYLSDDPWGAPEKYRAPALSFIDAQGTLSFFAADDSASGAALSFNLSAEGEHLGILTADSSKIDQIVYDPQRSGVSGGRTPDGAGAIRKFVRPSPGVANPGPLEARHVETEQVIHLEGEWRFHQQGEDLGVGWQDLGFNDETGGWESGRAVFHRVFDPLPLEGNTELEFLKPPQSTFYFRRSFQYSGQAEGAILALRHIIDDGLVVHLNGERIYDWNMKPGSVSHSTPAASAVADPFVSRPVLIPGTALQEGRNVLAAELHQSRGSKDGVFGLSLEVSVTVTNRLTPKLRLSEVMARGNDDGRSETPELSGDWIEIFNPSSALVELSGMGLTDDPQQPGQWRFPDGMELRPGAYTVIRANSDMDPSDENTGFGLDPTGEGVYLYADPDSTATPVDTVDFGLQLDDYAIGRVKEKKNRWTLVEPTPGRANMSMGLADPTAIRINEWLALNDDGEDWLELYNRASKPVAISGFYLSDDINAPRQSSFPELSYLGTGSAAFRQVIADNDEAAGANHVGFALSGDGESILLSNAVGERLDTVHFDAQVANESEGRFPDGAKRVVRFPEGAVTPGSSNGKDSDTDGIPDFWEMAFGLDPDHSQDKDLDRDGDGASNLAEFRAGTDPNDHGSVLRLQAVRLGGANVLRFKASEGRRYTLQAKESLIRGKWRDVKEIGAKSEGRTIEVEDGASGETTRYYRVVAHGFEP